MKIDQPLLSRLAYLARLEIDACSEADLLKDLNKIILWIKKLEEVDTANIRPLTTMSSEHNIVQQDVPQAPLVHKKALVNAPQKDTNYFRVPQVKE